MAKSAGTPLDPAIRRVRLGRLDVIEISEAELAALERGSPESVYLNLALATLPVALSFATTLLTTNIESTRTFIVFVLITLVAAVAGLTFVVLWRVSKKSSKSVSTQIRARFPAEGIQEQPASVS